MKIIYAVILALLMSNCSQKQKEMKKTATVMEVVTFTVDSTLSDSEVKSKLMSLTEYLSAYEGYVGRNLGNNEKGEWIDIVYWESLEQAKLASEKVMENEKVLSVFAIINQESMKFQHFNIQ